MKSNVACQISEGEEEERGLELYNTAGGGRWVAAL
jgi:hypothetical protein